MSDWISVKKQLPEIYKPVLVFGYENKNGMKGWSVFEAIYHRRYRVWYPWKIPDSIKNKELKITHWMLIPGIPAEYEP